MQDRGILGGTDKPGRTFTIASRWLKGFCVPGPGLEHALEVFPLAAEGKWMQPIMCHNLHFVEVATWPDSLMQRLLVRLNACQGVSAPPPEGTFEGGEGHGGSLLPPTRSLQSRHAGLSRQVRGAQSRTHEWRADAGA